MIRRPPRSTRTDTLFPYTTLFRSIWSSVRRASGRSRQLQPPFCTARIGVDLRDRAVDQHIFKVRRIGQRMEKPLPHAFVRPAPEAGMNRRPLAECLRQVAPMRRIAGHPQDRIHQQPVINPPPARPSLPPPHHTPHPPPLPPP